MVGPNVLNMPFFDDDRLKVQGELPVPAYISYQLDTCVISYLHAELAKMVNVLKLILYKASNRRNLWYTMYLTIFVLLHALEVLHQHQQDVVRQWVQHVS
jgi:hypothetical protein